jgi:FMN phosphatase YigB (HAD superfamily)
MIAALLFDFGGTLDGPLHWLDRFLEQYRAAEIEITRDELDHAFDHATGAGYRAAKVVRRFGLQDLVRFHAGNQIEFLVRQGPERLRGQLASLDSRGRHRLLEQITAGFVQVTREGIEAATAVLKALKPRYRIGVVSNFYGNLDRIMDESGMNKVVDSITDSTRVQAFKPDPAIFEIALRGVRAKAPEAAMIGDSLDKDCAPAHRLGLKTVWYRSEGSVHPAYPQDPSVADFTIAALSEVAGLRW